MSEMAFRLDTDELDEGPVSREFASKEAAIAYAAWWFLDGYMDNETMPYSPDADIYTRLKELIDDLEAGREFYCNRFYERASIAPLTPPE